MIATTILITTYIMELDRLGNFTIIKIIQASYYQADSRYGASQVIQCSCMSIMSISWTLFKLLHFWNLIDLDSISQKGDELLKSFNEFRYLGVEDLPNGFLIDFLENRTGKITVGAYLVYLIEIVSSCQQARSGALLIFNNCDLGLPWGSQCFYMFDSHSKHENSNISSAGTTVLLKSESSSSLENYIVSAYYADYPITLYFQIQSISVTFSLYARNKIRNSIRNRRKNSTMKRKYHDNPKPQKKYKKRKYKENPELKKEYQRKKNQARQNVFNKVEKFHQQIR